MNFENAQVTNKDTVTFPSLSGEDISVTFEGEVRQVALENEVGIALVLSENNNCQYLTGLNLDGTERFKVTPPKDWSFYYLSTHINHKLAVVCVSVKERFDWFYSIDQTTGELVSLNRAY